TGPIDMMPWGVEDLSIVERYKKALEAGVNIFSGTADPGKLIETLNTYPELMENVDQSVYLLLLEKFRLGLFENPYVNVEEAINTVGKQAFQDRAAEAMRKSIVLLRNEEDENGKMLPLKAKTRVYFETYLPQRDAPSSNVFQAENNSWDIELVNTPKEADVIVLWLIPKGKSLFQSDGSPLHVNLAENNIDVDYVNKLVTKKPTILAVNYTNPWAIDEVYHEGSTNIQGVLATFGTTPEALLDIISGKVNPNGRMPFSTPASDEKAQNQKADVPGYMEGEDYALFRFDEGMGYSK
ncbi:MAG: glycoside hydrolase family 3 C-terminal domain-containing protein, partial [Bacteroidetes bacterium]|nr:glycoside hydrolase family 3 C-terminal domain-containing protein [Bacteroidota bacterium]